jgi:DNA polymerase I-like protein with 3'-5' exonuclease and polymerase domains
MDYVLVGADASALQLAIYAHYVAPFDEGFLAAMCEDPDGDPHTYMQEAAGLYFRDSSKTLTYARWFGAQEYKLGTIVLADWRRAVEEGLTDKPAPGLSAAEGLGAAALENLSANMTGFADITEKIEKRSKRGFVFGLDGRQIPVSSARLALVSLLQGNEAVVMKLAYCTAGHALRGHIAEYTAFPSLWVHDEFQWACHPKVAHHVGRTLVQSITDAGIALNLRLKLSGDYKVGATWEETH